MFQFDSFRDFLLMDGHGLYVWLSYGISFAVMAYLLASPLMRARDTMRRLKFHNARKSDVDGREVSAGKQG